MLTITGPSVSRRDFLRIGPLCVGGLSMADLLRLKARARSAPRPATRP